MFTHIHASTHSTNFTLLIIISYFIRSGVNYFHYIKFDSVVKNDLLLDHLRM